MEQEVEKMIENHHKMVQTIRQDLLDLAKKQPELTQQINAVISTTVKNGVFFETYHSLILTLKKS